ncbi:hypothetical protein CW745_11070 [Psychromonas sp. psych-6C06]|uniref:hypothetical protein n=1 Tax=Psychromonas sp. psych-6C06 TaxID=2058089 RepID=UPI000C337071|nr:hypothetical protein [Psychromonas sp. psych-6C06]PKF61168.1 hypothetical protein CW745_11070 [Psychromonas sp. psych-6C06]
MNKTLLTTTKLLGVTVLLSATTSAVAVESVTSTATVTVQNAFTFSEGAALDFGTIRAAAVAAGDATNGSDTGASGGTTPDVASLTLASIDAGTSIVDGATAAIQILTPGTAGTYTIAGVAPYSTLTITLPTATSAAAIKLTSGSVPPGSAYFWMYDFEATVTSGTKNGTAYSTAGDLTADLNGDASFSVGATLATSHPATASAQAGYQDVAYTGSYTITVDY